MKQTPLMVENLKIWIRINITNPQTASYHQLYKVDLNSFLIPTYKGTLSVLDIIDDLCVVSNLGLIMYI